jgi:hypothetical protein
MKLGTTLGVAALAFSVSALAADQPSADPAAVEAALREACTVDIQNTCGGKQGEQMLACLRQNEQFLSPDCMAAIAKVPSGGPASPPLAPKQ